MSTRRRSLRGDYSYHAPRQMDDGLLTGTIEGALFDSQQLAILDDFLA
jgi:hypothetical protein